MDSMRKSPRTLALIALLAVFAIAATAGLLMPVTAEAVPAHGTHIDYYDSPSHTNQIGYRYYDCDGVLQESWGTTSRYSVSAIYGCTPEV